MERSVADLAAGKQATVMARLGQPAAYAGFTFQPAELKFVGRSGRLEHPLHEFALAAPGGAPAVLRLAFEEQYDAAWVRARLPRVFGFTPEFVEDMDSALLDVGILAQAEGEAEGVAFVCADLHGRAGLRFAGGGAALERRIAEAFWSLLLAKPDDLADFEQMVYHEPADVWLKFGCLHGRLFCEESED